SEGLRVDIVPSWGGCGEQRRRFLLRIGSVWEIRVIRTEEIHKKHSGAMLLLLDLQCW
ncbi:unnamed protein product, partial [Choristocarpus tenellus]